MVIYNVGDVGIYTTQKVLYSVKRWSTLLCTATVTVSAGLGEKGSHHNCQYSVLPRLVSWSKCRYMGPTEKRKVTSGRDADRLPHLVR